MPSRSNVDALPALPSRSGIAYLGMLENAPFGIIIVDKDFRLALISQGAGKVFSVVPDALGRDFEEVLRAIWPEPFVSEALGRFRHTLATGESYHAPSTVEQRVGSGHAEAYDWKVDRVLLPDGEPGVICYFHDLTERERVQRQLREAEVNKSFLLELSDALRPLADPAQLEGTACALMARHLGVDRAYFVWVDEAAGTARIIEDHVREGAVSVKGDHRTADFQWSIGVMRDGTCHVVADSQDATVVPARDRAAYAALDIRSFIGAPLIKEGALVGVLCITDRRVRTWQPDEASLVREVGERIWAAVEWARADQARREGDRRKDEFLATLAHELRNPLAPLRNGLEALQMALDQPDTIREVGAMMGRQVEQMVHLVNDLLDLSRISRGVIELREQAVDLHAALQQAVETARPMVDGNQQRLLLELSPAPLIVNGDPTRLAQIFGNLLDNAGKYTEKGGTITVRSYVQGDQAVIEVMDTGIGLSTDQLPRVFDMFSQVDRSYHRARGGLGIGLHIVKRLVEMQDGRVSVRSPGLGKGSTFRVELPLLPATHVDRLVTRSLDVTDRRLRILLADDNVDAGNMLGMLLKKAGHEVTIVHSGRQVLEHGPMLVPEIIILDIGMPEMDGFETCMLVRKTDWGRKARIVALTGWGQAEDRRRSREAGFDHHLVKPVDVEGLLGLVVG